MDLLLTTGTSAPDSALPGGPPGSATLVALYPGPALRLDSALAVAEANAEAEDMMDSDPRWLPELRNWLSASSVAPGLRSVPVESLRGIMIVEWAGLPLPDVGFLLLGRDDTLERQLRHTLTESRRRYKDLVEVSSDFAWETGPDGTFVFVSHKGALGYPADALIGRDPRSLALEETEDLPMPFDCRRAVDQTELWLKSADGTPACVVASALPLFGPQGDWIGARGVCRDVTEQVLRSNELARIRKRERLLGHIVHTLRDRLAAAASALAILAGSCGKIARDVALMMQTDVGEAFEPAGEGRGGSSTMPHKRNPVAAASALGCATMAPQLAATIFAAQVQDHERSAGPWHAEWPTLPQLMLVTSGALAAIVDIAEGLDVDAARMRSNLDATHGLIMAEAATFALAAKIGKSDAHHLVEAASKRAVAEKKHLREVLSADSHVTAHLSPEKIAALFEPMAYQGASQALIDRLLASLDLP